MSVGDLFPGGLFIAQDGFNVDADYEYENQNFKLADWEDIAAAFAE